MIYSIQHDDLVFWCDSSFQPWPKDSKLSDQNTSDNPVCLPRTKHQFRAFQPKLHFMDHTFEINYLCIPIIYWDLMTRDNDPLYCTVWTQAQSTIQYTKFTTNKYQCDNKQHRDTLTGTLSIVKECISHTVWLPHLYTIAV